MTTATKTQLGVINCIGIIRVSSKPQLDKYGPDSQQEDINNGCERLGFNLLDTVKFQESASVTDNRTEFEELLQVLIGRAKRGEIQAVMLGRWDRLGRDGRTAGGYYVETLRRNGIQIRMGDADFDVDPDAPDYDTKISEHMGEAKAEVVKFRKRSMDAKHLRAKSGKLLQGSACWAFDYNTKAQVGDKATGLPRLNQARAEWVRRWYQWIAEDKLSVHEVIKRTEAHGVIPPMIQHRIDNLVRIEGLSHEDATRRALTDGRGSLKWSRATIHRILLNPALTGRFYAYTKGNKGVKNGGKPMLVFEDAALAVMTPAEQEAVKRVMADNKALASRNRKNAYPPLSGFVFCGRCNRKAYGHYNWVEAYYECTACKHRDGVEHIVATLAYPLWKNVKAIITAVASNPNEVLPLLKEQFSNPENRRTLELRRDVINDQIEAVKKSITRLVALAAVQDADDEDTAVKEITRQLAEYRARLKSLESDLEEVETGLRACYQVEIRNAELMETCRKLARFITRATDEDWRGLFRDFKAKVMINPGGKHVLQLSLNAEPSGEIVSHQSISAGAAIARAAASSARP